MTRYRKKLPEIEAFLYGVDEIPFWFNSHILAGNAEIDPRSMALRLSQGCSGEFIEDDPGWVYTIVDTVVDPGWGYIILDTVTGSISLMKKEVFETQYEKVEQ